MSSISKRGQVISQSPLRTDLDISFEAQKDQYHPVENPEGTFPLNIAENRLQWPLLKKQFQAICAQNIIPDWVLGYTSPLGDMYFRKAIGEFYEQYLCSSKINPEQLAVSPGATGIIELSALILADTNNMCAIPAPAYPVYEKDLQNIAEVRRFDIINDSEERDLKKINPITLNDIKKAHKRIKKNGERLKMLVLTSPDNPTGIKYSSKQIKKIAEWCIEKRIHLIVNEIYALSTININHPAIQVDYKQSKFQSFLDIMSEYQNDYLHHWYSLSKDFGISGFRVGIVYTHNVDFIKAYENLNVGHTVSNHTQWMLAEFLKDHRFIDQYVADNQHLLTQSYVAIISLLQKYKIPYAPARGGLFIWVDLSQFLIKHTAESDANFWLDLYKKTGVLLTPGNGFGHRAFGKYRLVYPYINIEDLNVALNRLEKYFSSY